jgi:hypothetical protein
MHLGLVQLFMGRRKGARACSWTHAAVVAGLGRGKVTPSISLPFYLYHLLNKVGCLVAGQWLSLFPFWLILDWFLF